MARSSKKLQQMRRNPLDWRIADVEAVCKAEGIATRNRGGSHVTISHPAVAEILTVPAKRPIKPIYIRKLVAFVDRVREQEND